MKLRTEELVLEVWENSLNNYIIANKDIPILVLYTIGEKELTEASKSQ